MADTALLDRAFAAIIARMVATGQAPHYTELAAQLGLEVERGRELLHELMATGIPAWLHPGTDYIVSFPPFHNLPTQYRISIDGEQRWFAQCGFEALAVRWLFPGKTVEIDAPCLDCGEPLRVTMRDEAIAEVQPATIVGYSRSQVGGPPETRPWR
ncbi:MAG TPA: organomercurial lyase [Dehalococcoidia bacterium]|nr:organomercurial lyase [Dehalococcoidia bacterium]